MGPPGTRLNMQIAPYDRTRISDAKFSGQSIDLYLTSHGVRRRRRHLLVGADCEDDAKGLVRELSGDGRADAETAFRVGRVSYSYMLFDASPTQVTGGGG